MYKLTVVAVGLLLSLGVAAQTYRTEFVSFDMREQAERDDRAGNQYFRELTDGVLEVPVLWLDREIFVHVEGAKGPLAVNGQQVGTIEASPEEWNITQWITDGTNKIDLPEGARAWIWSQPKLRVEDFEVEAAVDSTYIKYGILRLTLVVANGYNFPETLNVGYDIYSPQGKLLYFDDEDITVRGQSRDTVRFEEYIYGMPANLWTAASPKLHLGMIVVRHDKRYTEYIPFKAGFGKTEVVDGELMRNGKAVNIKASGYDSRDRKSTASDLARLRKEGYNTIVTERPQPYWFYDLADETGFYVFDQPENPGAPNDPKLLVEYLHATQAMFSRMRNHVSVAGWSLGAPHGNGYNLYKTYQWLKERAGSRPVVYDGAGGEWNSDMAPILDR